MSLTQEEVVELDRFLTRMDKRTRGWWFFRWMTLAAGLFMITLGVVAMKAGIDAMPGLPVEDPTATVSALNVYSSDLSVMASGIAFVVAILFTSGGLCLVIFCLVHWRRDSRDRLLVKLARSCLAAQAPIP